jgi:hypothetical protein
LELRKERERDSVKTHIAFVAAFPAFHSETTIRAHEPINMPTTTPMPSHRGPVNCVVWIMYTTRGRMQASKEKKGIQDKKSSARKAAQGREGRRD